MISEMKPADFVVRQSNLDRRVHGATSYATFFLLLIFGYKTYSSNGITPFFNPYLQLIAVVLFPLSISGILAAGSNLNIVGMFILSLRLIGPGLYVWLLWSGGTRGYALYSIATPLVLMVAYWAYNTTYTMIYESRHPDEFQALTDEYIRILDQDIARYNKSQGQESTTSAHEGSAKEFMARGARIKFSDIVGMSELKSKLLTAAKSVMTRSKEEDRNGIMFMGEPGNGKTMFAEALAGELNLPFLSITLGDVNSMWMGQMEEHIVKVFQDARKQAPCVLFLDEIDSILPDRDSLGLGNTSTCKGNTVNVMLTELVKIRNHGVLVIGATNFPDSLDKAAFRDGRFDYKIEITAPDLPARVAIIKNAFAKVTTIKIEVDEAGLLEATKRWDGFSAARMNGIAKEVVTQVRAGKGPVTFDLLVEALRSVQGRAGKIPENARTVEQLAQPQMVRDEINGLALRMQNVRAMEEMGGTVPTGVLFFGAPGSGKTTAAMALAKSAGWAFLSVAGADMISDPKKIEATFRSAAELRPCVLFIDEADGLLANREYSHFAEVTNKFLTVMDGATGKAKDVMVIAATNYPEKLDPAAIRGGRFEEKLEFQLLDSCETLKEIQKWRDTLKLHIAGDLTNEVINAMLGNLSIGNVSAVLQQAVNNVAVRKYQRGNPIIIRGDITTAIKTIVG